MARWLKCSIVGLCAWGCAVEAPDGGGSRGFEEAAPDRRQGAVADRADTVAADGHRHMLDVDWVRFSELEIHRNALAVVRGRVVEQWTGSHRTYPIDPSSGRELTPEEAGDRFAELPLLTSVLAIDERLDGRDAPEMRSGARIEVVQLGGRYPDGCWVEPTDQRLLREGDEVAVFLKPAGMQPRERPASRPRWSIVGGQQGLVPLVRGLMDPIPETVFARYTARPVVELARDVQLVAAEVEQ